MNHAKASIEVTPTPALTGHQLLAEIDKLPRTPLRVTGLIKKLCGPRWVDILLHLPSNVQDRRHICKITETTPNQAATLTVKVTAHKPVPHRVRAPYRIYVADDSGEMELLFFNHGKWLENAFPKNGEVIIHGTAEDTLQGKQMIHPEFWPITKGIENIAILAPTYPLTTGVTQNAMQRAVQAALTQLETSPLDDWMDPQTLKKRTWPELNDALRQVHAPQKLADLEATAPARARLAYDELFAGQISLQKARSGSKKTHGLAHQETFEKREKFLRNLPFKLTGDQQRAIEMIDADMSRPEPMLRLVQGDVGSGKTVVALAALLRCVEGGHQGVMMAPTAILAEQHYTNAKKWLEPLGINITLLTGKQTAAQKKKVKKLTQDGLVDILIGTHALVEDDVLVPQSGLVVIDEQHRFGVRQRLALTRGDTPPDMLVMTATPIPRTLALTCYGDMDITLIKEKPPGRTPIKTSVLAAERIGDVVARLQTVMDKGEQVYWVCPLVEESEKSDMAAATARFDDLRRHFGDQVALLHGRMKAKEKDEMLQQFRDGISKLLVSTTVIEVGIDVPQASIMVIEHAERFGLSQLHQLRGRVGRGAAASHCVLLYAPPLGQVARERLDTMRATEDGFLIAEKDLELRGPGDVAGTQQAGHTITRVADLAVHKDLIPLARDHAREVLDENTAPPLLLHMWNKMEEGTLKAG